MLRYARGIDEHFYFYRSIKWYALCAYNMLAIVVNIGWYCCALKCTWRFSNRFIKWVVDVAFWRFGIFGKRFSFSKMPSAMLSICCCVIPMLAHYMFYSGKMPNGNFEIAYTCMHHIFTIWTLENRADQEHFIVQTEKKYTPLWGKTRTIYLNPISE